MNPAPFVPVVKIANGAVQVFDGSTGRFVTTLTSGALSFQVNGNLVSVTKERGQVVVYDALSGRVLRTL